MMREITLHVIIIIQAMPKECITDREKILSHVI